MWWIHLSSNNTDPVSLCGESTSAATIVLICVVKPHQQHYKLFIWWIHPSRQKQQHYWSSMWWIHTPSSNINGPLCECTSAPILLTIWWIHRSSNISDSLCGESTSAATSLTLCVVEPNQQQYYWFCKVNPPQQQQCQLSVWCIQLSSNITKSLYHMVNPPQQQQYQLSVWWIHLSSNITNSLYGESTSATTVPTFCMVKPPQ